MAKSTSNNKTATVKSPEVVRKVVGALDEAQISPLPSDMFQQILGYSLSGKKSEQNQEEVASSEEPHNSEKHSSAHSGELVEGDWMLLSNSQQFERQRAMANETESKHLEVDAAIEYHREIRNFDKDASNKEAYETKKQVEEIMEELKKLINSSKMLQQQFAEIGVDDHMPTVGKYHVNFLEWMLTVVQAARQNVEEADNWLGSVKHKNGKKEKSYWGMFKKHGTGFALSGERTASNSVG